MNENADIEHMSEIKWRFKTDWRGWNQKLLTENADNEHMNETNDEFKPSEEDEINN